VHQAETVIKPSCTTAALGCCKHSGPDLWLMTESGTGRILPSAAPGTFIAAPVLTPSVISPRHHPYPFLFPLLYWHESHFFFRRPSRRRVDFTGANVGGRACSLRFEVHFLQILPFSERVIGRKKHRERL